MSTSSLSSQDIRAAAEAHHELGPEYHDAVVASFLAKIETEIQARVDAHLASSAQARPARPARRLVDPATLARRRLMLNHMAFGSVIAGIPLTFIAYGLAYSHTGVMGVLVVAWILMVAVYAACAVRLRPSRRERD